MEVCNHLGGKSMTLMKVKFALVLETFVNFEQHASPRARRILNDLIEEQQFYTYGKQYSAADESVPTILLK